MFKNWINKGILYVKDLVTINGSLMDDTEISRKVGNHSQMLIQLLLCKKYILKRCRNMDLTNASFIKIRFDLKFLFKNKYHIIKDKTSSFFYSILLTKITKRGNMESIYSREFSFENRSELWESIYK